MSEDLNKNVTEGVNPVQEQSAAAETKSAIENITDAIAGKIKEVASDVADIAQDVLSDIKGATPESKPAEDQPSEEKPAEEKPSEERAAGETGAEKEIDFSSKSIKELVDSLKEYIDGADMRSLNKYAEVIKACFYKTLKKEKTEAGFDEVAAEKAAAENAAEVAANGAEAVAEASAEAPAAEVAEQGTEAAEGQEPASTNPFAEVERGFKALYGKYRTMRAEFMNEQNQKREENFEAKSKILQELKSLAENPGELGAAYPKFRELQNSWRAIGAVPPAKAKDLYDTYHHNVEVFYDYVKISNELREMDFKKNLSLKEDLCSKAEALAESANSVQAFRELQKLHEEWKELGPVAKEKREEIWDRFKAATAVINKKYQAHYEGEKEKQVANLAAKTALCEKAEAIANSGLNAGSNWAQLTSQMQELQKEWRTIGFAVKKENEKIYERFRAACDKFFTAKKQFHSEFKDQLAANLAKKEELCEKAEAVMNSEDWKKTSDVLINLQKQWKEIGPVAKKKSEQVWNRFRAACDTFFNNKEKNGAGKGASMSDNLAAKKQLIADIAAYELTGDGEKDREAMRDFQNRWREIGFIPYKDKDKVQAEYRDALSAKFGDISFADRAPRRSGRPAQNRPLSERDRLIGQYHKLEQDIATWENNIGFFEKSKNAEALVSDYRDKIEQAKGELAALEAKIKSLESAASEE